MKKITWNSDFYFEGGTLPDYDTMPFLNEQTSPAGVQEDDIYAQESTFNDLGAEVQLDDKYPSVKQSSELAIGLFSKIVSGAFALKGLLQKK